MPEEVPAFLGAEVLPTTQPRVESGNPKGLLSESVGTSNDLRARVIEAIGAGASRREAADRS
jgi:hypothetical protein